MSDTKNDVTDDKNLTPGFTGSPVGELRRHATVLALLLKRVSQYPDPTQGGRDAFYDFLIEFQARVRATLPPHADGRTLGVDKAALTPDDQIVLESVTKMLGESLLGFELIRPRAQQ